MTWVQSSIICNDLKYKLAQDKTSYNATGIARTTGCMCIMIREWNCLNILFEHSTGISWTEALLGTPLQTGTHLPEIVSTSGILGRCVTYILYHYMLFEVCVSLKEKGEGLRGGDWGQGSTVGSSLKKGPIREGIIEVYLHQLSARLLGWRRSCDPPAIVLELPAGNNQSHCYSRSHAHELGCWPEDQSYSLQPLREVQRKSFKRKLASWKQWSGKEREIVSLLYRSYR